MEREWIYIQNPFLNATADNYSKFNSIINYSNTRFNGQAGDAFFDTVIAIVAPSCSLWNTAYATWTESQGEHKGTTNTVQVLIDQLSGTSIGDWVRRIAVVYAPGTSDYIRLLPRGSAPFQTGKQADRILAVKNLITAIGTDAALTAVKADVVAFYADLDAAKTAQTVDLAATDTLSDNCEMQRIASCTILWQSLGMMITQFATTPNVISNYYDLENLRSNEQVSFTHTVHPLATAVIAKRKLTDTMQIRVNNTGDAEVRVYYAAEKNDAIGATYLSVPAGEDTTVAANVIGNLSTGHYIKVDNVSDLVDAHFTLSIIK